MKQVNVGNATTLAWKAALESIGFVWDGTQNISNTDYDIYKWPYMGWGGLAIPYIGIALGRVIPYRSTVTQISSARLIDFNRNELFDAALGTPATAEGDGSTNLNAIRYEYLKNNGIILTLQNLTTAPYCFAAFLPGENNTHGYVAINTAISGQIARIYNDGNLGRTQVINYNYTNKINTDSSHIQLVEAYDYFDDNTISNLYLCVTNPNNDKCSVAGCYQIIEVNDKRYFIIPVGDDPKEAKLAFEIADSLTSNS